MLSLAWKFRGSLVVIAGIVGILSFAHVGEHSPLLLDAYTLLQHRGGVEADPFHNNVTLQAHVSRLTLQAHASRLTLHEIAGYDENSLICPNGTLPITNTVPTQHPNSSTGIPSKIPRTIHITGRTRCVPPNVVKHIDRWRFEAYSLYFHDDDAMDRYLNQDFPIFPRLHNALGCISQSAAKADIWRYLIIWEFGGVYTDLDNAPAKFNASTIQPNDDAWFPLEALGIGAQYFFAASKSHPLMYYSLMSSFSELMLHAIGKNKAPYTTGPHALKMAFIQFLGGDGCVTAGTYKGWDGSGTRSVTIVGNKTYSKEFVNRRGLQGKESYWSEMNMTHFSHQAMHGTMSCHQHLMHRWMHLYN